MSEVNLEIFSYANYEDRIVRRSEIQTSAELTFELASLKYSCQLTPGRPIRQPGQFGMFSALLPKFSSNYSLYGPQLIVNVIVGVIDYE